MQETQKTQVQSLGGEDPLEKEMATHSSIPWTKEPRGLQSFGFAGSQTWLSNWALTHSRYIIMNLSKIKDKDTMAVIKKTGHKARIWRKENTYILLMRMLIGYPNRKWCGGASKIKNRIIIWFRNLTSRYIVKENGNRISRIYLYSHVYCSSIHISQHM